MNNITGASVYGASDDADYYSTGSGGGSSYMNNTITTALGSNGSTSDHFEEDEGTIMWGKIAVSIFIFVLGTIGNLVSLFVIVVLKEYKKSVMHMYVLQLAVADLLFLLTIPFKISEDIYGEWPYPEWLCTAKETMLFLNYNASVWFLMVMSIDRYIAVCHSFSTFLTKLREPLAAGCIIGLVWLIAILSCIPVIQNTYKAGMKPACTCQFSFPRETSVVIQEICGSNPEKFCIDEVRKSQESDIKCVDQPVHNYDYDLSVEYEDYYEENYEGNAEGTNEMDTSKAVAQECNYFGSSKRWFTFLRTNFVVLYILPIVVMSIAYGCIIHKVTNTQMPNLRKNSNVNSFKTSDSVNVKKRKKSVKTNIRNRVTIMSATLVCSFVLCWLPFHVIHLAKISGIGLDVSKGYICINLSIFASLLAYINSVINPYLYSFLGTDFGKRWRNVQTTVRRSVDRRNGSAFSHRTTNLHSTSNSHTRATTVSKGKVSVVRSSEGEDQLL